jgi:hypothetical protein
VSRFSFRVARGYISIPKKSQYFGGPWVGKCWYILWPIGIFNVNLVHFMTFGIICDQYIHFSRFGMLKQEKSGNPASGVHFLKRTNASREIF